MHVTVYSLKGGGVGEGQYKVVQKLGRRKDVVVKRWLYQEREVSWYTWKISEKETKGHKKAADLNSGGGN